MSDAVPPILRDLKDKCCPRCLQVIPPKAARCPGCGQPVNSPRLLQLAIGVAGVLVLLFASLVVYRSLRTEGLVQAPVPIEEDVDQQQQALFPDSQPAGRTTQPAKPEKRAPLDEH